jgi:two-component system chemotaxis response regulator CheY
VPRSFRVLVVDDDPSLRTLVCDVLADEGFDTRPAVNGYEALAILDEWLADVIVLDLMMPVMDGWAFRLAQRTRGHIEHIPVVVLSAARDVRADVARLDVLAVLPKPFDLEELIVEINRAFRGAIDPTTGRKRP